MSTAKPEFCSVLLEGLFYEKDGLLMVNCDGVDRDVLKEMEPLRGKRIHLALHHVPDESAPSTSWGQGCCRWQPSGHCPAGHHQEPQKLLVWVGAGTLTMGERWVVGSSEVPLYAVPGHTTRLVGVTEFDPSKLDTASPKDVSELVEQAKEMRDMIQTFRDHLGKL